MTWNYRVVHYKAGGYGLHEVYYDVRGKVYGYTGVPVAFTAWEDEGREGVTASMNMALRDAVHRPVLEEKDITSND